MSKYFVSYQYSTESGSGLGMCNIALNHDITDYDTIREIRDLILSEDKSFISVAVLNWRTYE